MKLKILGLATAALVTGFSAFNSEAQAHNVNPHYKHSHSRRAADTCAINRRPRYIYNNYYYNDSRRSRRYSSRRPCRDGRGLFTISWANFLF